MEARQVSSKLNVNVLRVEPLAAPLLRTRGSCLILLQCHQVRSPSRSKRSFNLWATLNDKLSGVLISSFTLPLEVPGATSNNAPMLKPHASPSTLVVFWPSTPGPPMAPSKPAPPAEKAVAE